MSRPSSNWIEQYSAALTVRDAHEQAHKPYIDAYTRLADRNTSQPASTQPSTFPTLPPDREKSSSRIAIESVTHEVRNDTNVLDSLRADLGATQKARTALVSQVDSLTTALATLKTQSKEQSNEIHNLTRRKIDLERKIQDRDEELRGKQRLVQEAQDEMIALGLQLNMAEQRQEKLERENRELVDRWMKRVGEDAERVNRDSKWT